MPSTPEATSRDVTAASDECRKNASKNRKENDWFGHDASAATGSRTPTSAPRTPNKSSRESEDWFHCDVAAANGSRPTSGFGSSRPDVTSTKARVQHGTRQDWYKHGADVPDPPSLEKRTKSKSRRSACAEVRQKATDPNDWFRHEHAKGSAIIDDAPVRPAKKPAKMASPTSLWVVYSPDGSPANPADQVTPRTRSRLTASEADDYYRRDKVGTSSDWFSHDHPNDGVSTSAVATRMRGTPEGGEIATRLKGESEDWFSHEGNRDYVSPLPVGKGHSPLSRELMERAQGSEIKHVFQMEESLRATWNAPPPLLGPEVVVASSSAGDAGVEDVRETMSGLLSNGQGKGGTH